MYITYDRTTTTTTTTITPYLATLQLPVRPHGPSAIELLHCILILAGVDRAGLHDDIHLALLLGCALLVFSYDTTLAMGVYKQRSLHMLINIYEISYKEDRDLLIKLSILRLSIKSNNLCSKLFVPLSIPRHPLLQPLDLLLKRVQITRTKHWKG